MSNESFLQELEASIADFCRAFDSSPPAYSYIPLKSDEERVRVMKSRLFNEFRAAELYGSWLKSTPELEVKAHMAESAHEEMGHAQLLVGRIRELGHDPFDYKPLPAQVAMFNALEGLSDTCQRIAGFSWAGESAAAYLIRMSLAAPSVPEWIKAPYRRISSDEDEHGSAPRRFLETYADKPERQDSARRAVAMRLVLFREYLASLGRWAMDTAPW
jgi:1,2-phenylacetyl-CoA epoxidase catalytic subunit